MKKLVTLGPSCTSSDFVAKRYFKQTYLADVDIGLFSTFEDAANEVLNGRADLLLVPHAYKNVDSFYMTPFLKLENVFIYDTPTYGIATKLNNENKLCKKLITHEAPISMIDHYSKSDFEIEIANSTSLAAEMVANGTFEFCVTNEEACKKYGLKFIKTFSSINMSWSIFARREEV